MHLLIACDKFKDTASADEVNKAIERGMDAVQAPGAFTSTLLTLSDGGDGFLTSLTHSMGLEVHSERVTGPRGEPRDCVYGANGDTVVVEMASAAGLALVPVCDRDPLVTTTYGVGELIKHALDTHTGVRRLWLGIGGSATNDAGLGALQVLVLYILERVCVCLCVCLCVCVFGGTNAVVISLMVSSGAVCILCDAVDLTFGSVHLSYRPFQWE